MSLILVDIGHIRIGLAGNASIKSGGLGSDVIGGAPRSWIIGPIFVDVLSIDVLFVNYRIRFLESD